MQVVIFRLKDEQFAINTEKVQGINDMMKVTTVPKAPAYIKGLINLRGNIISLLDINLLLDVEKAVSEQKNIIIINMKDEIVGIAVDEVEEVLEVEDNVIEKLNDDKMRPCIDGVINFKDRIVTLIDIDKIL